jgi:O-methyltransferase
MKKIIGSFLKKRVTNSSSLTNVLKVLVGNATFNNFIKSFKSIEPIKDKISFYSYINQQFSGKPVMYLEFGVHKGESMMEWITLNTHSGSVFYGFDSFEGLPESWQWNTGKKLPKGTFSTQGTIPVIVDERVHFIKGLFQNALLPFLKEKGPELLRSNVILHFDADLYSSELFCLTHLYEYLPDGAIIFFDDFFVVDHDFRALMDWSASHLIDLEMIACMTNYKRAAFRIKKRNTYL